MYLMHLITYQGILFFVLDLHFSCSSNAFYNVWENQLFSWSHSFLYLMLLMFFFLLHKFWKLGYFYEFMRLLLKIMLLILMVSMHSWPMVWAGSSWTFFVFLMMKIFLSIPISTHTGVSSVCAGTVYLFASSQEVFESALWNFISN